MWNALKSDLNVFVSTVAGDTSDALTRMDDNFPEGADDGLLSAPEERQRRIESKETFQLPLISEGDDEEYVKDVEEFLEGFSSEARTEEIAKLLEDNCETLKPIFEELVPTEVPYEDFWQRFFYRCDEARIEKEIEDERKHMEETQQTTSLGLGSFLGGAVKAVSASLSDADNGSSPFGVAGTNVFGTTGRPPFVMNTAMDDEEEEEEEELGWDDDDEEEDAEGGKNEDDRDADEQLETIRFQDPASDQLREDLKLALEERDQLQQTVQMQMNEIAALKTGGATVQTNKEIEQLKTQLFEKEAELAAVRASVADNSGIVPEPDTSQTEVFQGEIDRLREAGAKKDEELNEMQSMLAKTTKELEEVLNASESDKQALSEALQQTQAMQTRLQAIENQLEEKSALLHAAEQRAADLEMQVQQFKDMPSNPTLTTIENSSPESTISGVKVPPAEADGGDGWDDDW